MAWQAIYKYARMSARKARLVTDMIRGRGVQDALNVLKFTPHRAAVVISKTLSSAIANANEAEASVEKLVVAKIFADVGPTIKRFREKDRGRAHPILKRTCHITVVVEEE
jgi:large subunit ribosomal protein L22